MYVESRERSCILRVQKLRDYEERSFSFERSVEVKRKILRVWSGLVKIKRKNEIVKMSQPN